jgi:hypothetical protein
MLMSLVGLRYEKGCAGDDQQKLKLQTRLLVREGAPHQQTRNSLKIIKEKGKNWLRVPDGRLTPGLADRPSVIV